MLHQSPSGSRLNLPYLGLPHVWVEQLVSLFEKQSRPVECEKISVSSMEANYSPLNVTRSIEYLSSPTPEQQCFHDQYWGCVRKQQQQQPWKRVLRDTFCECKSLPEWMGYQSLHWKLSSIEEGEGGFLFPQLYIR